MTVRMPTKQEVIDALVLDDVNDIIAYYEKYKDTNYLMHVLDESYKGKTYNELLLDYGDRKWLHTE
jgi:uncharacterized protein (DUF433 family)